MASNFKDINVELEISAREFGERVQYGAGGAVIRYRTVLLSFLLSRASAHILKQCWPWPRLQGQVQSDTAPGGSRDILTSKVAALLRTTKWQLLVAVKNMLMIRDEVADNESLKYPGRRLRESADKGRIGRK